jgi:hypothetical protein
LKTPAYITGLILAALVLLGVPYAALFYLKDSAQPEVLLGLVIIVGVVVLMILLFIMAAGFTYFKLSDPKQALGLPEGTIRALIALILIMLFIITGVYLFRTVGEGVVTVNDLTTAQADALGGRVVKRTPVAGRDTFNVTLQGALSDDGGVWPNNWSQQLAPWSLRWPAFTSEQARSRPGQQLWQALSRWRSERPVHSHRRSTDNSTPRGWRHPVAGSHTAGRCSEVAHRPQAWSSTRLPVRFAGRRLVRGRRSQSRLRMARTSPHTRGSS